MKKFRFIILVNAIVCFIPFGAMAQTGFGLRAGVSAEPDQFHFGAHFASSPFIDKLTFRPNIEIGVGSHVTTVAANFEFAYRIPISKSHVSAYIGAGPALNLYRFSGNRSDTDSGGGFNVLIGIEHRRGLFGEMKVGALDSPEFKFTIGYTFK
jgi:hypothetical protein